MAITSFVNSGLAHFGSTVRRLLDGNFTTLSAADSALDTRVDALEPGGTLLWKDMIGPTLGAPKGSAAPTDKVFGPTGTVKMPVFAVNDSVFMAFHVPHDIDPGSTAYFHVHWATDGTDTAPTRWEISYTMAKGHGQAAFPADTVLAIQSGAATATAWYHEITEDATGFTLPEVDSLILCTLKRITIDGGADNADDVFGLFMDIHYQSDRDGTPYKAPNFYTGP